MKKISRAKPTLKNRVAPEIEDAVLTIANKQPGQVRVSNALRSRDLSVSPAGVRYVWQRHDLENMNKRRRL